MAFKIDDEATANRTREHLKLIARPSKGGPAGDAQLDWALQNDPHMLPLLTRMIATQGYEDAIEWRRLYCLTPCIRSTLMWSHYAEKHKGIVSNSR